MADATTAGHKPLNGFRVVELGGPAAMFCGKLLADLGCDVLRIEPPGHDPYRDDPPLVQWNGRVVSAAWLAYSTSKRAASLDVTTAAYRHELDRLLDFADLLVVSEQPAQIERLGLLPADVRRTRRGLVALAITPFGLDGPCSSYAASDLVLQSAGGFVYLNGDEDRSPVRISEEQTWPLAGAQAAFVAAAALRSAAIDGVGDSIDLSMQEAVVSGLVSAAPWWQFERRVPRRNSLARFGRDLIMRQVWPCKDGFVAFRLSFGLAGSSSARNMRLIRWMEEEGAAGELMAVPWDYVSTLELTQNQMSRWQEIIEAFLIGKTKAELYTGALARKILLFPVLEPAEILQDEQLVGRDFFVPFSDRDGHLLRFPGALYHTATGPGPRPEPPAEIAPSVAALSEWSRNVGWPAPRDLVDDPPGLLAGIVVADFGWAVAGPVLGRFLAHHGATVIKIESNERLDAGRASPPFAGRPSRNRSGFFDQHNAGKQSITVNLHTAEGRAIARRLALAADMVNENFAPGVMGRLGLDYATLSAERPDLIMVSASMQGQTGPNQGHPGLGTTLQALVGLCHLTGWPDREPVGTGEPYTDTLAPWVAGTALMAALHHRSRTGEGTYIDLSQFEAVAHFVAPALLHLQATGEGRVRSGNASPVRAPEGVYRCAGDDAWCAISVCTDEQWLALADTIGWVQPAPTSPRSLAWRLTNRGAIDTAIERWTSGRAGAAITEALQALGVPAYVVADVRQLYDDPQLVARDHWLRRDHPAMGEHLYEAPPFRLLEHAVRVEPSPLIGEHTDSILAGILGMSETEIEAARECGALS